MIVVVKVEMLAVVDDDGDDSDDGDFGSVGSSSSYGDGSGGRDN